MKHQHQNQRGYAIIELMITMLILVLVVQGFQVFMNNIQTKNLGYRDRAYATQKAVQMLEELRSVVSGEAGSNSVAVLDDYDDTKYYRYTLTTDTSVTAAAQDHLTGVHPLSDNPVGSDGYKYVRKVIVKKVLNDPTVRKVWVRVFYAADNAGSSALSNCEPRDISLPPLAEVFTVVQTIGNSSPPTQVMDVFLIAIENIPGWWVRPADLRPMVASALNNLQARNPGLRIRERWIRRMSYGRDSEYSPEINNETVSSTSAGAFDKAYVYPGWVPYDDGQNHFYLDPYWMEGRVQVSGSSGSKSMWINQNYAMADQWNHARRWNDELTMYNQLAGPSTKNPEISLRMLQEGMASGDIAYRNSIILNLHGELVPIVPLRNYSDAAKDPELFYSGGTSKAYRAVSHFDQLHYTTASEDPTLHVYAYNAHAAGSVEGIARTSPCSCLTPTLTTSIPLNVCWAHLRWPIAGRMSPLPWTNSIFPAG